MGCNVELKPGYPTVFQVSNGEKTIELTAKSPKHAAEWTTHIDSACELLRQTPLYLYNQNNDFPLRAIFNVEGIVYKEYNS